MCVDESVEANGRQGGRKEPHFAADLLQRSELLLFCRRQLALLLRDALFLLLLDLFLSVLLLLFLLLFLLVFVLGILGVRVTGCGGGGVQFQGLAFSVGDWEEEERFSYWAVQRSQFARVNAFCDLLRKKSQKVAAATSGPISEQALLHAVYKSEVEARVAKRYKCRYCCVCKNYSGNGQMNTCLTSFIPASERLGIRSRFTAGLKDSEP